MYRPPQAGFGPPPMMQQQQAPYGRHAGLGTANAPQNIAPINIAAPEAPVAEKYSLFLGNISENVDDFWLDKILSTAGNVASIKRIKDANGIPKTFGFVEYADPESVLRCLGLLNNVRIPVLPPAEPKPLTVKADAKTQARLDEYAATKQSKEDIDNREEAMEAAQNDLRAVLDGMVLTGNEDTPEMIAAREQEAIRKRNAALHLQDLGPDELPEESRGVITREIAFFRERAAKREADRKAAAAAAEAAKAGASLQRSGGPSNSYPADRNRQNGRAGSPPSNHLRQSNNSNSGSHYNDSPRTSAGGQDRNRRGPLPPQERSLNNFVRSNGTGIGDQYERDRDRGYRDRDRDQDRDRNGREGYGDRNRGRDRSDHRELTEDEVESNRIERLRKDADLRFRDKERKWESHERSRQAASEREKVRDIALQKDEDAQRMAMAAKLAEWNDAEEIDRGKELFHVDRIRWRAQRKAFRNREIEQDRRDAEQEAAQLASLEKASTDFLNSQSDLFHKSLDPSRRRQEGTPAVEEAGPIKLTVGVQHKKAAEVKPVEAKTSAFGALDDGDDAVKRKRELVTLTYSDEEDDDAEEVGLTEKQKQERRTKKLKELVDKVPTDKAGLWSWEVRWDKLTETTIKEKIAPFATKKVVEAIGSEEQELVDACVEHIRAHKSAESLVEELEPVLADEATEFVVKIWRFLIFETLAATYRIKTSAV